MSIDSVYTKETYDETYSIPLPFVELEFNNRPSVWVVVLWLLVGIVVSLGFLYAAAFLLPSIVGFEASVLLLLAVILLRVW